MTDRELRNEAYLQAAFGWLRARFAQLLYRRVGDKCQPDDTQEYDRRVVETEQVWLKEESRTDQPPPALLELTERLHPLPADPPSPHEQEQLDREREFEKKLLLLCLAVEREPLIARACGKFHGDKGNSYPTFALAQQLFCPPGQESVAWQATVPEGMIRYWHLIDIKQPDSVSLADSSLRATDWLIGVAQGRIASDHVVRRLVEPLVKDTSIAVPRLLQLLGVSPDLPHRDQERLLREALQQRSEATGAASWQQHDLPAEIAQALDDVSQSFIKGEGAARAAWLSSQQLQEVTRICQGIGDNIRSTGVVPLVQFVGPDPSAHRNFVQHLVFAVGRRSGVTAEVYVLKHEDLPSDRAAIDEFCRLWQRECYWQPKALYVELHDAELPQQRIGSALRRMTQRTNGIFLVGTREPLSDWDHPVLTVEVGRPKSGHQYQAWQKELQDTVTDTPAMLASHFDLSLDAIQRVAEAAILADAGDAQPSDSKAKSDAAPDPSRHHALWQACLERTQPRLNELAQRIECKATFDDIVLPQQQKGLLREIASQAQHRWRVYDHWNFGEKMNRGLGISALLAGESGTGKTMAAEVIANELNLPLYRIDLSAVISKYIGETEKNLRRLFDAFEDGGAALLFDEADSLFGKRSEVKDSHDRYANIQIDYLLQRMESFRGLSILATNMKGALDQAFLRRLRFVVDFPVPEFGDRKRIWQRALPAKVPCDEIDFDRLAKFRITGGNIQTIVINAAFQAAAADPPVLTMQHLLQAAKNEHRKLQRPINDADFRYRKRERSVA